MKRFLLYSTVAGMMVFSQSCHKNPDNPQPEPTGCVKQVVEVPDVINVATEWDSCHIYHIKKAVGVYAPLTIDAGTIVKFGAIQSMFIVSPGSLTVNGVAGHEVIFTSEKDDSYGGDNNGDGTATSPQKGDWQDITFGISGNNHLNYCKILYAGSGSTNLEQALNMGDGENNTIRNSVIAHTAGGRNQIHAALDMAWCPQSCVSQNNTFFDNGHPVTIGISSDFDNSNVFHNPDNPLQTNVCNGIFVDCVHSTQALLMTWSATEVAFVLGGFTGNSWAFLSNHTLVLGFDVIIKFAPHDPPPGFSLLIPDGEQQIVNAEGLLVGFTSYDDDFRKGDTNGDGISTGTSGSWDGIYTTGPTWYHWGNIYYAAH